MDMLVQWLSHHLRNLYPILEGLDYELLIQNPGNVHLGRQQVMAQVPIFLALNGRPGFSIELLVSA